MSVFDLLSIFIFISLFSVVAYTEIKRRQSVGPVLPISLKDVDSKAPLLK